jgi:hypothetical protein
MNGYVLAGWAATFVSLGAYATKVLLRERVLKRATTEIDLREPETNSA